jgi:phage shock protein C
MIAGVCAGFALHYGWDITVVRIVTAVIAFFSAGTGILAYLAAWVIIPEAPYALPVKSN